MTETERLLLFTVLSMVADGKRITVKGLSARSGISRSNIYYYINKQKNKSFKELLDE